MPNNRNLPCECGSGRKFKKCCLNNGFGNGRIMISDYLAERLDLPCWFHGSTQRFDVWQFPPPPKPNDPLLAKHTAIFFTSDRAFAEEVAGNVAGNVGRVSLSSTAKILDTTFNYEAAERLRCELLRDDLVSRMDNVDHDFWHSGWVSGAVLRVQYTNPEVGHYYQNKADTLSRTMGISNEEARIIVAHNSSRELAEAICVAARRLGFDAIFGHEIDRHTEVGRVIAQPWLAVLSTGCVTDPEWDF